MEYTRKVVWITGASAGIGEALARRLAREGAALALSARRHRRTGTCGRVAPSGNATYRASRRRHRPRIDSGMARTHRSRARPRRHADRERGDFATLARVRYVARRLSCADGSRLLRAGRTRSCGASGNARTQTRAHRRDVERRGKIFDAAAFPAIARRRQRSTDSSTRCARRTARTVIVVSSIVAGPIHTDVFDQRPHRRRVATRNHGRTTSDGHSARTKRRRRSSRACSRAKRKSWSHAGGRYARSSSPARIAMHCTRSWRSVRTCPNVPRADRPSACASCSEKSARSGRAKPIF